MVKLRQTVTHDGSKFWQYKFSQIEMNHCTVTVSCWLLLAVNSHLALSYGISFNVWCIIQATVSECRYAMTFAIFHSIWKLCGYSFVWHASLICQRICDYEFVSNTLIQIAIKCVYECSLTFQTELLFFNDELDFTHVVVMENAKLQGKTVAISLSTLIIQT